MSVKERLKEYLIYKKISMRQFSQTIGVSSSYVNNINKSIQPDKVNSIAIHYPDLNTGWLLTGEGYMLNTNEKGPVNLETYITVSKEAWEVIKKQADGLNAQAASLERRDKQIDELISIIKKTYILDKDNTTCPITSDFKLVK